MKKLLLVLLMLVVLTLSACKSNDKKSIDEWAIHYAIEDAEERYEGFIAIGYTIERYEILEGFDDEYEHYYTMVKITLLDQTGGIAIYNVLIGYEKTFWQSMINIGFKEDQIVDYDIEAIEGE